MKIEIRQAIASVFGISAVKATPLCGGKMEFQRKLPTGVVESLGCVCHTPLNVMIRKLVADPCTDLTAQSHTVPINLTSNRQPLYAIIELECLMQERELKGVPLIEVLDNITDSRQLIELIMDTLRGCAVNYLDPEAFTVHLGRTIVVALTAFEWARREK